MTHAVRDQNLQQPIRLEHAMNRNLITFEVNGETFGIDSLAILEIRAWSTPTIVPGAPDYMVGVVNRRGSVLPVVDLAIRLGWKAMEITARHAIIVICVNAQEIGLIVEAVSDMVSVDVDALQPPPSFDHHALIPFIDSLVAIADRLVMILDPQALGLGQATVEIAA
jgi:purine-binding chemotaxis protein CheW